MTEDDIIIRYNFDADSKGDYDLRIFDTRMVRAKKDHTGACFPCLGDIKKGERHRTERALFDGAVRTVRSCRECCDAMVGFHFGDWLTMESRYSIGRQRADALRLEKGK